MNPYQITLVVVAALAVVGFLGYAAQAIERRRKADPCYRDLNEGEVIQAGDEWGNDETGFTPAGRVGSTVPPGLCAIRYRRRVYGGRR